MRAPDLHDVVPSLRLLGEARVHELQRGDETAADRPRSGDMHCRREAVDGGLSLVLMINGLFALLSAALSAHYLVCSPVDDLICIHVGLGARASLPDDQG